MIIKTREGKFEYAFHLFGVRVPGWLYGAIGPYVPYRFRRVDWHSCHRQVQQAQSAGDGSANLQVGGDFYSAQRG